MYRLPWSPLIQNIATFWYTCDTSRESLKEIHSRPRSLYCEWAKHSASSILLRVKCQPHLRGDFVQGDAKEEWASYVSIHLYGHVLGDLHAVTECWSNKTAFPKFCRLIQTLKPAKKEPYILGKWDAWDEKSRVMKIVHRRPDKIRVLVASLEI